MMSARRLLVEPARPARVRDWSGAPWLAVGTVCVGAFMSQLDASIVTLVLPRLSSELHASLGAVQWVSLSYLLVLVGTVTAVGRVADLAGRKLLYVYGFGIFTLGSLGCGLAPSLAVLLAMRVVQGVGAALLQANSVALIRTSVPADRLHRAIAAQGGAQALGLAAGPSIGGLLIAAGGWRWVFWVNLPAGLIGIGLGLLLLPRSRHLADRRPFDWAGTLSLLLTVSLVLLGLSVLPHQPGIGLPLLVAAGAVGGCLLAIEARVVAPLLDAGLFRSGPGQTNRLASNLVTALLGYLVLFGVLVVSPLYLAPTRSPGAAGLLVTTLPLALGLFTPVGALAADRFGARSVITTGLLLAAAGCLVPVAVGGTGLVAMLALVGAGLGLVLPANNATIAASGRAEQAGLVSGLLNMTRGIGTALGVAIATACFTVGHAGLAGLQVCLVAFAGLAVAAALAVPLVAALAVRLVASRPVRPGRLGRR